MTFRRKITLKSNDIIIRMRSVIRASTRSKVAMYTLLMPSNRNTSYETFKELVVFTTSNWLGYDVMHQ